MTPRIPAVVLDREETIAHEEAEFVAIFIAVCSALDSSRSYSTRIRVLVAAQALYEEPCEDE